MLIGRRAFLTGLLAAPIIVRAGIIMPVRPLAPGSDSLLRLVGYVTADREVWHVYGRDMYDHFMVETIRPGQRGQKLFRHISHIETS